MTDVLEPAPAVRASPWQVGGQRAGRRRRLLLASGTAFALVTAVFGLPTGREVVTGWLLLLLYAVVGGDARAWGRAVLHDWLPFLAVLFGYDTLRGFAPDLVGRAHVLPQLRADEFLFHGTLPTVWLQQHLYTSSPAWYDYVIVPVYLSHFVAPTAVAAGLWAMSYARFRRYVWSFVVLTVATLTTYAVFPAEPPWLASQSHPGLLAPVVRVTTHTLQVAGIPTIHNAVERGESYANPVAAIPSLHSAVPMLIVLLAWPYAHRLGHLLLTCYLAGMTFTLVYGGEHYVIDVLIGWAYAAASVLTVRFLMPRFDQWRAQRSATSPAASSPPPV